MPKSRHRKIAKARTGKKQRMPLRPITQRDKTGAFLMSTPAGRRGIKPL